jgi:hypothetical protein
MRRLSRTTKLEASSDLGLEKCTKNVGQFSAAGWPNSSQIMRWQLSMTHTKWINKRVCCKSIELDLKSKLVCYWIRSLRKANKFSSPKQHVNQSSESKRSSIPDIRGIEWKYERASLLLVHTAEGSVRHDVIMNFHYFSTNSISKLLSWNMITTTVSCMRIERYKRQSIAHVLFSTTLTL